MRYHLHESLLAQEVGRRASFANRNVIYGNRQFIDDLDVVNELEGHTGCVNALSWSRSGRLLASGSDDRTVNIYSYQPDETISQFSLATTIETSHSANIFSVKFMPNTNDSTIITCAGDQEVRVFDIERTSASSIGCPRYTSGSANGKVFRSHSSAAKRLVTEASPYYFLSCSEDGEVRQWDIRRPETAYPRKSPVFRRVGDAPRSEAPPPLISYAPYGIELWTISCSPTQPHYIALGGTHIHCFLHDRRMLGRNRLAERGATISSSMSQESKSEALSDATRCVAKFAPHGQPIMTKNDSGKNISACKLGTAYPNELLVSWMGEYTYAFNIMKDIADAPPQHFDMNANSSKAGWAIETSRKRKRNITGTAGSPPDGPNVRTRVATESASLPGYDIVVRVGGVAVPLPGHHSSQLNEVPATGAVAHAQRIRTLKNALAKTHFAHANADRADEMAEILASARQAFERIDAHIAARTYPVTSSRGAVEWELKLRSDRAKVWRYTQSSATLARVLLGYRPQRAAERVPDTTLDSFDIIRPAPREGSQALDRHEHFGYDFIKAVLLWLESGVGAVLREFSADSRFATGATRRRLPIPPDAGIEALDTHLIPYLSNLAADIPIVYAGHGGAGDDPRTTDEVFSSERAAVLALGSAMKLQFEDLHGKAPTPNPAARVTMPDRPVSHNREAALTFWGHRVCMAVLNSASIDVNYPFVSTAFSHPNDFARHSSTNDDDALSDDSDSDDEERHRDAAEIVDDDESSHGDEDEAHSGTRNIKKTHAARHVPATSHARTYMGHCNVETTKDVNFYGGNDEYVVSGSDCGNFFIWDKKNGRLLNILKGDNEVVNVIQPHPYEPMLAVSGIDSTVKIFSPDSRARRAARHAFGIARVDPRSFSSLNLRRNSRRTAGRNTTDRDTQTGHNHDDDDNAASEEREPTLDEESSSESEEVAPNGLESCRRMDDEYAITSENDMNRRSGNNQRYISRGVMELLAARLGARVDQLEDANSECSVM